MTTVSARVLNDPRRLVMPIAVHPGASLVGATVRQLVHDPEIQAAASLAVQRRLRTEVLMSAMDLSTEAEAFGCAVGFSEDEVPTVTAALIGSRSQADALRVPEPGELRTHIYIETVARLRNTSPHGIVLAGCIGPFSLASRLIGMTEALTMTITDEALMHAVLEKAAAFLVEYVRAFKAAGANGIIVAEPGAGLLSPKALSQFSSCYVRRMVEAAVDDNFDLVLHNCAAKLVHLPAILQSGARVLHFGAPMDLPTALTKVPPDVIVCGNLDPSAVFVHGTAEDAAAKTRALINATTGSLRFVPSSGCDIPATAPMENLEAFVAAAA